MMLFILNNQIGVLEIIAIVISLIALVATIRKKEYGKFYFISKNKDRRDIWISVIKSDLYDLKFVCEPYKNMNFRISSSYLENEKDLFQDFLSETKPIFEIGLLKERAIVKFVNCNCSKIHISYRDKYNNQYNQELTQKDISKRHHKNFWNLTFVGT